MIKPSDAIKDPGLDSYFKKTEKEMRKKIIKDYINYIFGYHVDADSVLNDIEARKKYDEWQKVKLKENETYKKWEDFMNKPTTPIKIFYSQSMHDKTEDEIKDKIDRLDNYIYGILMYGGFKQEDILRIEIIDSLHHEGLDPDAGRLKNLGASIQLMEDADLIIFDKDWDKGKGCRIEKMVAETYVLHWLDAGEDKFPILLSNWFNRFLERENVSK